MFPFPRKHRRQPDAPLSEETSGPAPGGLQVLKYLTRAAARSPELMHLQVHNLHQARQVFEPVETTRWNPGLPDLPLREAPYVLLMGRENVFLMAASLRRMKRALDDGASVVLPSPITHFAVSGTTSLHTMRNYETRERQILENEHRPHSLPDSQLPCALIAGDVLRRSAENPALLLSDPTWLARQNLKRPIARVGVYHSFIDYYGETREDIISYLPEHATNILEVGCGRGHTGALIQQRLNCRVTGVELNPEIAADAADRLWQVIVGDILEIGLPGSYDAVVATELLEHLTQPDAFLTKVKSVLKPGGRIVLSVPNVGHYSVVDDLLAGRWDYLPIGLLCYTHYRFFTRTSLVRWIEQAGYDTYEIIPQRTELPERFAQPPAGWDVDHDSLSTSGFWVVIYR